MITRILILVIVLTMSLFTNGQNLTFTKKYKFLGYINDQPIFNLYDEKADNRAFYTLEKKEDLYGFKKLSEFPEVSEQVFFVNNDIIVGGAWDNSRKDYRVLVFEKEKLLDEIFMKYSPKCVYSEQENFLFIFVGNEPRKEQILSFDFNADQPEPIYLPLKGYRGYTVDDWFYFAYYHENYDYSPYPDDIFRVKIGYWHNPELIFTSDEYDDWFLYPKSHVIATDIDLNDNETNENNQILYDVKQEAYAVVSNIKTNSSSASAYLKYEGNYYGYFKIRDNTRGLETIGLELLPPLPDSYPNKEGNEVLPREVWYNVPLKEKSFDGAFITPYLLREAPRMELSALDKSKLRLLRNAIYAQYGYVFNSKDLQEFYSQFEWYRMMTAKREDNNDIILLPEDKERAELIREIEAGKN